MSLQSELKRLNSFIDNTEKTYKRARTMIGDGMQEKQEEIDLFVLYRMQNLVHIAQENLMKNGSKPRRKERRDRRTFTLDRVQERNAHGNVIESTGEALNELGNRAPVNEVCPGTYWRSQLMLDQIKEGKILLNLNARKVRPKAFLRCAESCGRKAEPYRGPACGSYASDDKEDGPYLCGKCAKNLKFDRDRGLI